MVTLLETDALFVTLASTNVVASGRGCTLTGAGGELVATARDHTSGLSRLGRVLGNSGRARYDWTVSDAEDRRLLEVVKPRTTMRGFAPEVSLANGSLLGRAVPTRGRTPTTPASLQAPDGRVLGELVPALGERRSQPVLMYRVVEGEGDDAAEVGEIAIATEGAWGFHVGFGPEADLSVRALTIAWTLCLVQARSTTWSP
ncbi:hypothetical protein [Nocardioides hwasunensis]|uniref:Scramblase n=1 Tax=Nocardioides hwasunensis TaxID=397258 RepID=A0ABR8MJS9_9ACTN|nr:hypothetical protein [Nocardioides hwasunensis]MBD3915541.1 hypothetical protein [Nocardioides hwasunensis]